MATSTRKKVTTKQETLLIIAGEHSGDLLGSEIMAALQVIDERRRCKFIGTGGELMLQKGLQLSEHIENMTIVGVVESLRAYKRLKLLAERILSQVRSEGIRYAILIDYPGFNLRLAAMLRAMNVYVIYVVSPQIWGWHYSRIHHIKKNVNLMLPLFHFEEEIYQQAGLQACHCIGHPLVHRIPREIMNEKQLPQSAVKNTARAKFTIGLLPGSRRSEIRYLLDDMLAAAKLLRAEIPGCRFIVAGINSQLEPLIKKSLQKHSDLRLVEYYTGRTLRIMQASDLLIIASGTATLEGAYFKKPMVLVYRTGWINTMLAIIVKRSRFIGIVNILARKQIVPELLQIEVTPQNIARAAKSILMNPAYYREIKNELAYVRQQLGSGKAALVAAEHIARFMRSRRRA